MSEFNLEIKKIIENYLEYSNSTIYQIEKNKIISRRTILNILKNSTIKISKTTIEKLLKLPNIKNEDYEKLKNILSTFKKNKIIKKNKNTTTIFTFDSSNETEVIENLIKNIEKNLISEISKVKFNIFEKIDIDFPLLDETKKIIGTKNDYETINRAMKTMWLLNDTSHKYFSELNLLLSTNALESNVKLKKGILEVSENLIKMGEKLKGYISTNINDEVIEI